MSKKDTYLIAAALSAGMIMLVALRYPEAATTVVTGAFGFIMAALAAAFAGG